MVPVIHISKLFLFFYY